MAVRSHKKKPPPPGTVPPRPTGVINACLECGKRSLTLYCDTCAPSLRDDSGQGPTFSSDRNHNGHAEGSILAHGSRKPTPDLTY